MEGEHREQLLGMAATWDGLADERERLTAQLATFGLDDPEVDEEPERLSS